MSVTKYYKIYQPDSRSVVAEVDCWTDVPTLEDPWWVYALYTTEGNAIDDIEEYGTEEVEYLIIPVYIKE